MKTTWIFATLLLLTSISLPGAKESPKFATPFMEKIEGWTIEFSPDLQDANQSKFFRQVKKALANHLQRILYLLPKEKSQALRKLVIRVDRNHKLGNMQYHPNRGWLLANGHDPSLEKRVHVPRARALIDRGTWIKHQYVILHEIGRAHV